LRAFMNLAAAALVSLAGLLTASAQNPSGKLERTSLFGSEYIRLTDWAGTGHWQVLWTRRNEEVQLTNSWSKLVFTVDSHRAEINGVTIFLSSPVALRNGTVFLSLLDVETALNPVLFPPRNTVSVPIVRVCLDPGHGGKDPGNEEGRRQEKDYTLLLARDLRELLAASGLKVAVTRNGDNFIPLPDRSELARKQDADLFVSLHFNAVLAAKEEIKGVEVYCLTPAGAMSSTTG